MHAHVSWGALQDGAEVSRLAVDGEHGCIDAGRCSRVHGAGRIGLRRFAWAWHGGRVAVVHVDDGASLACAPQGKGEEDGRRYQDGRPTGSSPRHHGNAGVRCVCVNVLVGIVHRDASTPGQSRRVVLRIC